MTALPKAGPSVAESSYVAGLKALTEDRLDDADRSFRGCLEVAPKAAACMLGVATVASQRGNPQASGLWIERAAQVEPDNAHAQASLGRWRAVNGQMAEAVTALEAAIRLDPKAVRPRVDLGDIYLASGRDVDRAIKLYREAIATDEKHAGAHYALGVALTRKGDAAGARTEFQRAAALSPGNPLPALGLAELFAASGDLKQAEQYAREAVKTQPGLLQSAAMMAIALPVVIFFLVLAGSVVAGFAIVCVRRLAATDSPPSIFMSQSLMGFWLVFVPAMSRPAAFSLRLALILLAIGLVAACAQMLMTWSYRRVEVATGSLLSMLTPVINVGVGVLAFQERFGPVEAVGAAIILAACTAVMALGRGGR